ncbi:SDR family NAD(P)-dependent oxidoreductase [Capillimicrobium parvum]|nr:SDR family oxidoreductase [Capillimicrobium parvum]
MPAGAMQGRVALVTGSARGLGEAIARRFAAEGATVVVSDVREELGEAVATTIRDSGGRASFHALDVTSPDQWSAVVGACRDLGGPHVLVNNAFVTTLGGIEDETLEGWHRTLDVVLTGAFLGMNACVPAIREAGGGSIVSIGSIHGGAVADEGRVAYQAAKGGLSALTRAVAVAHGKDGIRANVILPGPMDTPIVAELGFVEQQRAFAASLPLGRQADPAEVASAALFLASDAASFATGAVLTVDGGFTAV